MKSAFIFNEFCCPRPLDFNNLFTSNRGLSGSDIGVVRTAQIFANELGHDVYFFGNFAPNQPTIWENVKLFPLSEMKSKIDNSFDAIVSWLDPNPLFDLPQEPVKLVSEQLNSFNWCKNGFDNFVDIFTSPSETHKNYQLSFNVTDPNKWHVVPNGCDPELYRYDQKVPGRCVFTSSPDRGLENILSIWSQVREAVPYATLRIFYDFNFGDTPTFEKHYKEFTPDVMELGQRCRFIQNAIPKLKHLGVEHIGSISRDRMIQEMNEAMCLTFSADCVKFTEGFSLATLESCSSKSSPVLCGVDALGEIYKGVVPMVDPPIRNHLNEYRDLVIKTLTDENFRNEVNERCYNFAKEHSWIKIAKIYEQLIMGHSKFKN